MKKLTPVLDRVFVTREKAEELTEGGLILPDVAVVKAAKGVVTAVGPGKQAPDTGTFLNMTVEAGDKILFNKYEGVEVRLDGVEYLILQEKDIFAVL